MLAPTRELTQQIVSEVQKLAMGSAVAVCGIFGGEPIERQIRALARGIDLVVGTPGRVLDHIERRTLYLGDIVHVVLDEADRMLDIGFRPDIERILRKLPTPRQTLLLSATINADVRKLAHRYMYQPIEVNLSQDEISVETIKQYYVSVSERAEAGFALAVAQARPAQAVHRLHPHSAGADRLADRLHRVVKGVSAIHGDLPQSHPRSRDARDFGAARSRCWSRLTSSDAASTSRESAT